LLGYFKRLFERLEMTMTPDMEHFLKMISARRDSRISKSQEQKQKKHWQLKFHQLLQEHAEDAKKDRCKQEGGVYQPGIGMAAAPPAKRAKRGAANLDAVCSKCGERGHWRPSNKLCKCYAPRGATKIDCPTSSLQTKAQPDTSEAVSQRDADELDLMDMLPFDDNNDDLMNQLDEADDADD